EVVRLEAPRYLQFRKVARVDLVERRVARAAGIAAIARPLSILRSGLRLKHRSRKHGQSNNGADRPRAHSLHVILLPRSGSTRLTRDRTPACLGGLYCCSQANAPVPSRAEAVLIGRLRIVSGGRFRRLWDCSQLAGAHDPEDLLDTLRGGMD